MEEVGKAPEWTQGAYDTEHAELGGAAATLYGIEMVEVGEEIAQKKALMEAVLTGCHVKHHKVLLPGRVDAISPTVAASWINKAMDEAVEKEGRGEPIITACDVFVKEYQEMQARVWQFVLCTDLFESDTQDEELIVRLHINRMLRIGALANGNEAQIREYGNIKPVFLSEVIEDVESVQEDNQDHVEFDKQFSQLVSLAKLLKKKRKCCCFPLFTRRTHKKE